MTKQWRKFWHAYVEAGLCDPDRGKTLSALRTLADRLPEDDWERIPEYTRIFAPSTDTRGLVAPISCRAGRKVTQIMVYLAPQLENESQSVVDAVVAHEFAHVVLRHEDGESFPPDAAPKNESDLPQEIAANKLIRKWGYALPQKKGKRHAD